MPSLSWHLFSVGRIQSLLLWALLLSCTVTLTEHNMLPGKAGYNASSLKESRNWGEFTSNVKRVRHHCSLEQKFLSPYPGFQRPSPHVWPCLLPWAFLQLYRVPAGPHQGCYCISSKSNAICIRSCCSHNLRAISKRPLWLTSFLCLLLIFSLSVLNGMFNTRLLCPSK